MSINLCNGEEMTIYVMISMASILEQINLTLTPQLGYFNRCTEAFLMNGFIGMILTTQQDTIYL